MSATRARRAAYRHRSSPSGVVSRSAGRSWSSARISSSGEDLVGLQLATGPLQNGDDEGLEDVRRRPSPGHRLRRHGRAGGCRRPLPGLRRARVPPSSAGAVAAGRGCTVTSGDHTARSSRRGHVIATQPSHTATPAAGDPTVRPRRWHGRTARGVCSGRDQLLVLGRLVGHVRRCRASRAWSAERRRRPGLPRAQPPRSRRRGGSPDQCVGRAVPGGGEGLATRVGQRGEDRQTEGAADLRGGVTKPDASPVWSGATPVMARPRPPGRTCRRRARAASARGTAGSSSGVRRRESEQRQAGRHQAETGRETARGPKRVIELLGVPHRQGAHGHGHRKERAARSGARRSA